MEFQFMNMLKLIIYVLLSAGFLLPLQGHPRHHGRDMGSTQLPQPSLLRMAQSVARGLDFYNLHLPPPPLALPTESEFPGAPVSSAPIPSRNACPSPGFPQNQIGETVVPAKEHGGLTQA